MAGTSLIEKYSEFEVEQFQKLINNIGQGKKITYKIKEKDKDAFHKASLFFLEMKFENEEPTSVVVKFMKKRDLVKEFKNEIFMYKTVIHSLNEDVRSICPNLIYTSPITDSFDMVIVLEDLTEIGFQVSPRRVKMELEEIRLSLKALGKYHAEMYTMKLCKPGLFSEATKFIDLNNAHVVKNSDPYALFLQRFMKETVLRTFDQTNNNDNNKMKSLYETIQKNGLIEMCLEVLKPEEPIAVICHGDFNRNNLMFRYENGVPVECKVIDLQTPCYGSPSIDTGFILFMNMESSDRVQHWTSLWHEYYDALLERLQINMGDDFVIPSYLSFESLQNDFKRKCFLPFIISQYFTYGSFCDMEILNQMAEKYFEVDEKDEESRIEAIRQSFDVIETEEVIRITKELTLEFVERFSNYL